LELERNGCRSLNLKDQSSISHLNLESSSLDLVLDTCKTFNEAVESHSDMTDIDSAVKVVQETEGDLFDAPDTAVLIRMSLGPHNSSFTPDSNSIIFLRRL
jgi:hypothetical protein